MARMTPLALVFLIVFATITSTLEGRRLLESTNDFKNKSSTKSLNVGSLFLSALPKGKVPVSTPSKKGHSFVVDEKLIGRRHLAGNERFLQSVPSPGVGH